MKWRMAFRALHASERLSVSARLSPVIPVREESFLSREIDYQQKERKGMVLCK